MGEMMDGFLVTDGRKKLWEVELGLIELVEKICLENNLNYFLIGGAAIGAVRHGGFIPWDDDMDIGMLRADFDRFVSVFQNYRYDNYIMEYGINNGELSSSFLRIRDKRTTAIIRNQMHASKQHGVFIEIYPFDRVPENEKMRKQQINQSAKLLRELNYRIDKCPLGKQGLLRHPFYHFCSTEKLWNEWNQVCTAYNNDIKATMVDTPSLPRYARKGIHLYHLEDVSESKYVDYGGHKVRVAKGNDRCLRIHFGDYMKLPPIEKRGMDHSCLVFYDAFTPWTEYMNTKRDIIERFFDGEYKLSNIW